MSEYINDYISLAEYAKMQGVTPSAVRRKILRGNLPAVKIGRNWMINKHQVYTDHRKSTDNS